MRKPSCIVLLLALGIIASGSSAQASDVPDAVTKANYLTKFAPFVAWPARSFAAPDSPLRICIAGPDPFGAALAQAAGVQQVQGHPITIEHPDTPAAVAVCHILFVSPDSDHPAVDLLHAVEGKPVLTVTDRSRGVAGGMIQFVILDGRVRFIIDAATAEASGVQISSKLLELAVMVQR